MAEACLFDIMALNDSHLRRVLPKASVRMISRLITAYPRSVGRIFIQVITETMSPATLEFIREEMHVTKIPTYGQIREAERELFKIMHDEQITANTQP